MSKYDELPAVIRTAFDGDNSPAKNRALRRTYNAIRTLSKERDMAVEALRPFVDGAAHTMVFLKSREKMHPCGQDLYQEEVDLARATLAQLEASKEHP